MLVATVKSAAAKEFTVAGRRKGSRSGLGHSQELQLMRRRHNYSPLPNLSCWDTNISTAAVVLVAGVQRCTEMGINVFDVCNAHPHEGRLRETTKQQGVKLTGTVGTCRGCGQAKRRRGSIRTMTSSRILRHLQRVLVDLAGPAKMASVGGAPHLVLFKDDATRMG